MPMVGRLYASPTARLCLLQHVSVPKLTSLVLMALGLVVLMIWDAGGDAIDWG